MALPKIFNRARMTTATAGTGTVTLASAVTSFATFAEASILDGDLVHYLMEEGNDFEIGIGTYTAAGTTLSRDTVILSKIGGAAGTTKMTLAGTATVSLVVAAQDHATQNFNLLQNISLAVSASGSALTIALKDAFGNDHSAVTPGYIGFRSATGTTSVPVMRANRAALSVVIPSTALMGVTTATAFRLWVGIFDDAGTLRLGVVNCLLGTPSAPTGIYPLRDNILASSTTIGVGSDSAGVIYSDTGVSAKAFRILGYVEWNTSGVTAGTWTTTNIALVQLFGPGVSKPGDVVQVKQGTTSTAKDSTSSTYEDTNLSVAITPTSAANAVLVAYSGLARNAENTASNIIGLHRDSTQVGPIGLGIFINTNVNQCAGLAAEYLDMPQSASSITYMPKIKASIGSAGTVTFAYQALGTTVAVITAKELMV